MAIEIVDFPIKNDDFPLQNVSSPEGTPRYLEDPLNDAHVPYNVPFQGHALGLMAVFW